MAIQELDRGRSDFLNIQRVRTLVRRRSGGFMKSIFSVLVVVVSLSSASAFACRCVNVSGNPAYDTVCQQYGNSGMCSDLPNICLPVNSCVNVSGQPAYDQLCLQYGAQGLCSDLPNICQMVMCR